MVKYYQKRRSPKAGNIVSLGGGNQNHMDAILASLGAKDPARATSDYLASVGKR